MQVFALTGQQNELMTTALTREQPARWTSQGHVGRLYDVAGPVTGPVCPSQQPHAHALRPSDVFACRRQHCVDDLLGMLGLQCDPTAVRPALAPLLWRWAKAGSKMVDGEATMLWTTPCVAL